MAEAATVNTTEIRMWNAEQRWGPHDPDGRDGYYIISALCDEVDRLRESNGRSGDPS